MLLDILKAKSNMTTGNLFADTFGKSGGAEEQWETLYENENKVPNQNTPYNYFWLSTMKDIYPSEGSVWRVTIDGVAYRCTAIEEDDVVYVGNPKYDGKTDDGSDVPVCFFNYRGESWMGYTSLEAVGHSIKIERKEG